MKILRALYEAMVNAYKMGGWKYFRHNLSCELRHRRYPDCWWYKGTFEERFLFSLGVFVMNPLGPLASYWRRTIRDVRQYGTKFNPFVSEWTYSQYTRHPFFGWWFRRYAVKNGIPLRY